METRTVGKATRAQNTYSVGISDDIV